MITGKTKRGDKIKISTRSDNSRVQITLSVIYANGGGFAAMAGSVEEAKAKSEQALGVIAWDQGD